MKEADRQNLIRLALNDYAIIFRVNSGKVRMADGRFFDSGVPNGYTDLSGFRLTDAKAVFIEVKNAKGKLRKEQKHFIDKMNESGAIAGVARTPEEAIRLVTEGE